jgi:hypothetical protein
VNRRDVLRVALMSVFAVLAPWRRALPQTPACVLCGCEHKAQPQQLKPWKAPLPLDPIPGDVLRCSDAKGCQARLMQKHLESGDA